MTTKLQALALTTILSLGAVTTANAQPYAPAVAPPNSSDVPWFAYRHASTEAEGYFTGQARLLDGLGSYEQKSAYAAYIRTIAYSNALDNKKKYVNTYFDVKDANAERRKKPQLLTKTKLDQWNSDDQPERLSRREYNVDSGSLAWPAVLQAPVFDRYRLVVDDLFARRTASEFGVNSPLYQQVSTNTAQMKDLLKKYLKSEEKWFSAQEYTAAQNFLNGLNQEARLAPVLDGLTAN